MNQLNGFPLIYLDSLTTPTPDDSTTPRIVKNIERVADRYRKYIDSEITEELDSQAEQAERVKKLKSSDKTEKRNGQKTVQKTN